MAKQSIVNRVKYHAPIVYDDNIDRRVLFENGIDINLPIFKFEKKLNKRLLSAIAMAQKECKFNAVFSSESLGKMKENKLKKLENYFVYSKYSQTKLIENINKLNINYRSFSNYDLKYQDKFLKVNERVLNPNFDNFVLHSEDMCDGVTVKYREFVLNGNNVFVKFFNTSNDLKKISFEFNFPLKKGYYIFNKQQKVVVVENIITKERNCFNFIGNAAKFDFSAVNGLENSKYCCINLKCTLSLKPKQVAFSFFNFGKQMFLPGNVKSAESLCDISQKICFSKFDIRIKSKDYKFDEFFNITLPKRIWLGWVNLERDARSEEKYKTYRKLFVSGRDKICFTNFAQLGVREICVFNGECYKKISIILSDEKFLKIGKTSFCGVNCLSTKSLKTKEPISISLG